MMGRCDVDAMLDEMTAEQLTEWQEFFACEPWGFPAESNLTALVTTVVANSAPFRSGEPIPFSRFLWQPDKARERAAKSEAEGGLQELASTAGANVLDIRRPLAK